MKKINLILLLCVLASDLFAQCVIEPFSLQKRTYISDVIVEAKVVSKRSVWDDDKNYIYTIHELELYKIFQGQLAQPQSLELVTIGGQVGLDMLKVEPSLEIQIGEFGLFFLKSSTLSKRISSLTTNSFEASANVQSFVKYDPITLEAHSYFNKYNGIGLVYEELISYTDSKPTIISQPSWEKPSIKPLAAPIITSWSVDTITGGTGSVLTLNGSNFGIARGKGTVEFRDANYGDGRYYDPVFSTSFKFWSNSKIEVIVPSRAGTGPIRVTNNGNESTVTSALVIDYSHLNVSYSNSMIDTAFFQIDMIDDNAKGGYTWQMNTKFRTKNNAVNSFMRAVENWRCHSLANWDVGNDTTIDTVSRDEVNIVRFTTFTDSKLGVCYSWYNGCFNSGDIYWFVSEMDIEFDSSRNWYYGTGTPGKSQFDFESVATHELGHGHQLGHVIDDTKLMNYSIGPKDRRVILNATDIAAAEYVIDKSKVTNPCGPSEHEPILLSACNITVPKALFILSDTLLCPSENTILTSKSEGIVKTYNWNFGVDASLASATTVGPHTINYSNRGQKTIQLIVGNDFGFDTAVHTVTILPEPPSKPMAFTYEDSICTGTVMYTIDSVTDATEYLWELPLGGNINGNAKQTTVEVDWTLDGGPYALSVKAVNSCGSSDTVQAMVHLTKSAKADYSFMADGRNVDFTFTGEGASSYSWTLGSSNSADKDPSYLFPSSGVYQTELIVRNHCSADTMNKEIEVKWGASISDLDKFGVRLYPNPVSSILTIENNGSDEIRVVVFSPEGRKLNQMNISSYSLSTLDMSSFAKGIYIVEIGTGFETIKQTVIKQ